MPWRVEYQMVTHVGSGTQPNDFVLHEARRALDKIAQSAVPYKDGKALQYLEASARNLFGLAQPTGVSLFAKQQDRVALVQLVSDRMADGLFDEWWESNTRSNFVVYVKEAASASTQFNPVLPAMASSVESTPVAVRQSASFMEQLKPNYSHHMGKSPATGPEAGGKAKTRMRRPSNLAARAPPTKRQFAASDKRKPESFANEDDEVESVSEAEVEEAPHDKDMHEMSARMEQEKKDRARIACQAKLNAMIKAAQTKHILAATHKREQRPTDSLVGIVSSTYVHAHFEPLGL